MDQANISVRTGTYSTRILGTTISNVPPNERKGRPSLAESLAKQPFDSRHGCAGTYVLG